MFILTLFKADCFVFLTLFAAMFNYRCGIWIGFAFSDFLDYIFVDLQHKKIQKKYNKNEMQQVYCDVQHVLYD